MSQQTFSSSSSYSYSSSSSSSNGQTTGSRQAYQTTTDPSGNTTMKAASQNLGEPMITETRRYDGQGRELLGGGGGAGGADTSRRIEDVSDAQAERDRQYEERIEEEYAKREGGA